MCTAAGICSLNVKTGAESFNSYLVSAWCILGDGKAYNLRFTGFQYYVFLSYSLVVYFDYQRFAPLCFSVIGHAD